MTITSDAAEKISKFNYSDAGCNNTAINYLG